MDTEETETPDAGGELQPPGADTSDRDALIAAAEKAARGEKPADKGTPERDEAGKFKPKPKAKAEAEPDAEGEEPPPAAAKEKAPPAEEDESSLPALARSIRQREREQAKRDALDTEKAEAAREKAEAAAELAAAKAEREAAAQERAKYEAMQRRVRESPRAFAKEIGWGDDGLQEFAGAAVEENTPAAIERRKLAEHYARLEERLTKAEQWREEQVQAAKEQETQAAAQREREDGERAIKELLAIPKPETTPNLIKLYGKKPHLFVAEAQKVASDYYQRTGQVAQLAEIVEYLEYDAAETLGASPPQQASGANGGAAKVKANGSRSLSAQAASERRSAPKPIGDMTPDEERDELARIAVEAQRTST